MTPRDAEDTEFEKAVSAVSDFAANLRCDDIPVAIVDRIGLIIADGVASIAAGTQQPEVRALARRHARADLKIGTIIGTPLKAEPRNAALINGTAGTTFEIDEGNRFARGHPGIHVVPSGFATAETLDSDSRDLLTAIVAGYEAGARIGAASRLRDQMQSHGTWGAIGAAVTVAKLRRFDRHEMRQVIDVASCLGLGSNIHAAMEGGTVRNVYAGVGNAMGLLAADLVESGYSGGRSSLKVVYGAILSDAFEPRALTDGLGQRWEIARNYFKIHACCRHLHGIADNVLQICTAAPGLASRPDVIAAISVESYSKAAEMTETRPINMTAAKFSAPFVVATTLAHGVADIASFGDAARANPLIAALAAKVTVRERSDMTAQLPHKRPSRVVITMTDGRTFAAETDGHKGDPENPHDLAALENKFLALTTPVWGNEAPRVRDMILHLRDGGSLSPLFAVLGRGPQ